jgi:hypothetical protein
VVTISNPVLSIGAVEGHPGERFLQLVYDLSCAPTDPAVGRALVESILVHAVDEHDAPALPRRVPIADMRAMLIVSAGTEHRSVRTIVQRTDLDVEQDWWSSSQSGEPTPIAEWLDHIAADIVLLDGEEPVARATTPTVTGSWGALGQD